MPLKMICCGTAMSLAVRCSRAPDGAAGLRCPAGEAASKSDFALRHATAGAASLLDGCQPGAPARALLMVARFNHA
jgi:hypothetical protein